MTAKAKAKGTPRPLGVALLTVSDSRSRASDTSGNWLADSVCAAGHRLERRLIVPDDVYQIRAALSQWIAEAPVEVVILSGGTGFSARDSTPEAVLPLLDKEIPGFGELFRAFSQQEIGSSTIQSRALAGLANGTAIFCLPGSPGACRTAWEKILREQLDSRHKPCNFAELLGAATRGG